MVVSGGVVTTRRGSLTPPLPPRARSARQTHYTTYNMRKGGGEWTRRVRHDRNCPFPFPTWTRTHVRNNSGGSGGGTRVPRQSGAGRTRYNNNTSVWKLISNRRARNAIKIYTLLLRGRGVCITDNFVRMKIGYRGGEKKKRAPRNEERIRWMFLFVFIVSNYCAHGHRGNGKRRVREPRGGIGRTHHQPTGCCALHKLALPVSALFHSQWRRRRVPPLAFEYKYSKKN